MKERPILFSAPMVRAILDGRKSQTRRIIKKQPHGAGEWIMLGWSWFFPNVNPYINLKCPYGQPGDILWVRKTWRPKMHNFPIGWPYDYKATAKEDCVPQDGPWKPSIFMPKEASRLKLKVTNIRVERVQDITEEDAIAEGIEKIEGKVIGYPFGVPFNYSNGISNYMTPIEAYMALWESINGKDSWQSNPWVWVIEFERI